MKTLKEIKDELSNKYWQCSFSMAKTFVELWQIVELMDECAKIYASQALDEVKERIHGLDSLEPVSDCMQYIEDLKNELN